MGPFNVVGIVCGLFICVLGVIGNESKENLTTYLVSGIGLIFAGAYGLGEDAEKRKNKLIQKNKP